MQLRFSKYQGTGNDFVMIDDRHNQFDIGNQALIERLCDRRFGIGGDGLILLRNHPRYDFEMVYFNSDGRQTSMCGNGGRCITAFAHFIGIQKEKYLFLAIDGEHEAYIKDQTVHLKMNDVDQIATCGSFSGNTAQTDFFTNTGSPHYVAFVPDVNQTDVYNHGQHIRYSEAFAPGGTNVNFVSRDSAGNLSIRTYERGVEDETYSCGTGVTAAALVSAQQYGYTSPVKFQTKGGQLAVSFETNGTGYRNIYLTGPAQRVFDGVIDI